MINKKIDEISAKLETIKVLVQDNEYLSSIEKRCEVVNKRNQTLENRIQKAIEYIENEAITEQLHTDHTYITIQKEELLDILKGSEDNDK